MKALPILIVGLCGFVASTSAIAWPLSEHVVISNRDHYVSYEVRGEEIIITMEALTDFTDERIGKGERVDNMNFYIDVDQNGKIDEKVDVAYAARRDGKGLCPYFLIDETKSHICGSLRSNARVEALFEPSTREKRAHPIFKYIIPRTEVLGARSSVHIVFRFEHSTRRPPVHYPKQKQSGAGWSFDETLKLTF